MEFCRRHLGLGVALIAGLLLVGRIIWVHASRTVVQGDSPVKEVEFHKHWITVIPLPGTRLDEFVDLRLFGDFRPGITFEEAAAREGAPDNIRTEDHNTYYEYWGTRSRVEVGREEYAEGGDVRVDWVLYAFPKDIPYTTILSPAVSRHMNSSKEQTVVQIMNQRGEVDVLVYVRGLRVDHVIWYQ
jgi:hypothetical protein